jgi:hypothetical protein
MSGEELGPNKAAPVVAANDGQNELPLLKDLVRKKEKPMGEAEGGSELSEPNSDWEDKREKKGEGKKKKDIRKK